ncbi:hypothetical protein [Urbifossiella limnaea]|nr:hypothetical protein [Urbifossiella limnaea]
MTKADAVRAAVAEGVTKPQDACEWIKTKFGIDITPQHFSSYKSQQAKKEGGMTSSGKRGRKPAQVATGGGVSGGNERSSSPAELARQVKALVQQYGAENVSDMLAVLSD